MLIVVVVVSKVQYLVVVVSKEAVEAISVQHFDSRTAPALGIYLVVGVNIRREVTKAHEFKTRKAAATRKEYKVAEHVCVRVMLHKAIW